MFQLGKTLAQQGPPNQTDPLLTYFLIILLLVLVILAAVILYRYFSPNLTRVKPSQSLQQQIEHQTEKEISESQNLGSELATVSEKDENEEALRKARADAAIQVLTEDEKKIVETLVVAGGTMLQKEISWKTGYSRVKTHRVLVRLIGRGVVSAEKYYNTNRIVLSDFLLGSEKKTS
jgi:uncharacterized membrane protein